MPLQKKRACSDKVLSENIAREIRAGKPRKQAVAAAYSTCRASKKASRK